MAKISMVSIDHAKKQLLVYLNIEGETRGPEVYQIKDQNQDIINGKTVRTNLDLTLIIE